MFCAFPTLFLTGAADFFAPRPRSITIGNYFKHLMMYHDQRFAKHSRFRYVHLYSCSVSVLHFIFCRYFALNTEMRHRALQTGRLYVRQNLHDGHFTFDELRDMVWASDAFSGRVLHFGASLPGTRQFWLKAEESSYCYGGHTRSAHYVLHTQCC